MAIVDAFITPACLHILLPTNFAIYSAKQLLTSLKVPLQCWLPALELNWTAPVHLNSVAQFQIFMTPQENFTEC